MYAIVYENPIQFFDMEIYLLHIQFTWTLLNFNIYKSKQLSIHFSEISMAEIVIFANGYCLENELQNECEIPEIQPN